MDIEFVVDEYIEKGKLIGDNETVDAIIAELAAAKEENATRRERIKEQGNAVTTLHRSIAQADTNDALSNGVLYAQVLVECAQRIGKEFNLFDYWGRAALKEGE